MAVQLLAVNFFLFTPSRMGCLGPATVTFVAASTASAPHVAAQLRGPATAMQCSPTGYTASHAIRSQGLVDRASKSGTFVHAQGT